MISLLSKLKTIWFSICCYIYDFVITYPLTKSIYTHYSTVLEKAFKGEPYNMIDIGTGTGSPLKAFMGNSSASRVKAIDINEAYVRKAERLFKDDPRVDVELLDWMKYLERPKREMFDVVFFGFSFMLMPDKRKVSNPCLLYYLGY